MKNFKKLFKLQWKKNSIWILLLLIGTLLINTLVFRSELRSIYDSLTNSVTGFEYVLGIDEADWREKPEKLDEDYIKYGRNLRDRVVKKYNIIPPNKMDGMDSEEMDDYYNVERKDIFYKADSAVSTFDYYIGAILNEDQDRSIFTPYTNFFMFPFLLILAMLMTSIESMSKYFDFTRMFPWSKTKDFLMKIGLGLILILIVYGIHIGIEEVIVGASGLSEVYNLKGILVYFIRDLILYFLVFLIFMGTGIASGNIFGHLGLNIVIFGFFRIIVNIISVIQFMLNDLNVGRTVSDLFDSFKEKSHPIVQHFLDPMVNMDASLNMLLGYGLMAAIVLILGILVARNMKTENSGYMVANKPIKIVAMTMAIFSLTSIIFMLVSQALADYYNIFIGLALYLFFLFASYKFFKALFNIRIKV